MNKHKKVVRYKNHKTSRVTVKYSPWPTQSLTSVVSLGQRLWVIRAPPLRWEDTVSLQGLLWSPASSPCITLHSRLIYRPDGTVLQHKKETWWTHFFLRCCGVQKHHVITHTHTQLCKDVVEQCLQWEWSHSPSVCCYRSFSGETGKCTTEQSHPALVKSVLFFIIIISHHGLCKENTFSVWGFR